MRNDPWRIAGDVLPPAGPADLRTVLVGILYRVLVAALSGVLGGATALGLFG